MPSMLERPTKRSSRFQFGFGLNAGIIDGTQFSLLVTVVVLSAVVPTAIGERWFLPDPDRERHEERRHVPFPAEEYIQSRRPLAQLVGVK